ncbi:hypothetical protein GCM10027059_02120 [Myceligenerans halotolerans]
MEYVVGRTARKRSKSFDWSLVEAVMEQHDPLRHEKDGRTWLAWLGDDGQGGQWEVFGQLADDDPDLLIVTHVRRFEQTFTEEG